MAVPTLSYHARPNADGSVDPRFPFGDKPIIVPASLTIDLVAFAAAHIDLTNRPQNTPIAINYRQYLLGTSAATAILSVAATSGPLGNWIAATDSLTNTASLAGSGSITVSADDGAGTVVSFPVQAWSILIATQQKKFLHDPGFYWITSNLLGGSTVASDLSSWRQISARTASNTRGMMVCKTLGQLINPNGGSGDAKYDGSWDTTGNSGTKMLDALMAGCAPKKFMLQWYLSSSSGGAYNKLLSPQFMSGSAYGSTSGNFYGAQYSENSTTRKTTVVRYWDSRVLAEMLALIQYLGAKYNTHPQWILLDPFSEVTGITYAGMSDATFINSLNSLNFLAAARAAFANRMLLIKTTYLSAYSDYPQLFNMLRANFWSVGEFDTCNETGSKARVIAGAVAFRGLDPTKSPPAPGTPGYVDYRPDWDYHCQIVADELGAVLGDGILDDMFGKVALQNSAYCAVLNNSWTGPLTNRIQNPDSSPPDLIDNINTRTLPRTAYPKLFP